MRVIGVGNLSDILYGLIHPARILWVSRVYKRDGSISRRVKIDRQDKSKLKIGIETIEHAISSLSGEDVEVMFA